MNITLTLDEIDAQYLLDRLGGPLFIDAASSDRERREAVSHDCIVGQLERGLGYGERAVAYLVAAHPSLVVQVFTAADAETGAAVCQWFALCDNEAAGVVAHSILGHVPTCSSCADRLGLELIPATFEPARD